MGPPSETPSETSSQSPSKSSLQSPPRAPQARSLRSNPRLCSSRPSQPWQLARLPRPSCNTGTSVRRSSRPPRPSSTPTATRTRPSTNPALSAARGSPWPAGLDLSVYALLVFALTHLPLVIRLACQPNGTHTLTRATTDGRNHYTPCHHPLTFHIQTNLSPTRPVVSILRSSPSFASSRPLHRKTGVILLKPPDPPNL